MPFFIDGNLSRVSKDYSSDFSIFKSFILINIDINLSGSLLPTNVKFFDLLGFSKDQSEVINAFVEFKVCWMIKIESGETLEYVRLSHFSQ